MVNSTTDRTMVNSATAVGGRDVVATQAILRGRDLLCFSHDWNGDPLSKNHLMQNMILSLLMVQTQKAQLKVYSLRVFGKTVIAA